MANNALKNDTYAQAAFGTTTESKIAALKALGYQATYGYSSLNDWDILKKNGMSSAGARVLSDNDGNAYYAGYSALDAGAKYVLSAKYYKEKGYEFSNFDHQYYFAGMFSGGAPAQGGPRGQAAAGGRAGMPGSQGGPGGQPGAGGAPTEGALGGQVAAGGQAGMPGGQGGPGGQPGTGGAPTEGAPGGQAGTGGQAGMPGGQGGPGGQSGAGITTYD